MEMGPLTWTHARVTLRLTINAPEHEGCASPFPSHNLIRAAWHHSRMTPTTEPFHDTWIDRLWREYINLRKSDLYQEDKEPPDLSLKENTGCHDWQGRNPKGTEL